MKKTRIGKVAIAMLMATTVVMSAGCFEKGGQSNSEPMKEGVAHLNVQVYKGGYGTEWMSGENGLKARFEKAYENTEFIPGTKGVQLHISEPNTPGDTVLTSMGTQNDEVFFVEQGSYYMHHSKMLPITDMVKETMTEYNEDRSVFDKMDEDQQNYYEIDGEIYGVPHYTGFFGLTYDIDLFNNKGLYLAKDGIGNGLGVVGNTGVEKTLGLDGVKSEDDGLPATYDEFFILCDAMVEMGVTPFCYAGSVRQDYIPFFLSALMVDVEGYDQAMLNFEFDGTATDIVKSLTTDENGKITSIEYEEPTKIENSNGYLLRKQAGRAYALSFLDRLMSNPDYYDAMITNDGTTHPLAHMEYIRSAKEGRPVAFYTDGIYWENEAAGAYAQIYGESWKTTANRHFGFMPFPKPTADWRNGNATTLYDHHNAFAFIRKDIDPAKIDLAKTFLQFCCTDESLIEFTEITNCPKAFNYTMPSDKLENMTSLGQSIIALKEKSTTKVVYPFSHNALLLNRQSAFKLGYTWTSIDTSNKAYATPVDALKGSVNASDYFKGLARQMSKANWDNAYSDWF